MTEKRPMQPKIKITGVNRLADIEWVNITKPDFAGFIFSKSHNRVTLEQAEFLRRRLDPDIKVVGIFSNTSFWLITAPRKESSLFLTTCVSMIFRELFSNYIPLESISKIF